MVELKKEVPGPRSRELFALRQKYVASGVSTSLPIFVREAKGATITDVDGNQYIDFAGGIGVLNVGHCPDDVVEAVKEQLNKYIHVCFHVAMYEPYVRLAERLAAITPGDFPKKTMFVNSGAEAVENAIKIARKYTGKTGVIALECAFHGRTLMCMTLTGQYKPYKHGFAPFASEIYKIPSAYCYRCYFGLSYPSCELQCAKNLERFLAYECPADHIAALLAESVQGEGGFIVPPPEFLPTLKEICAKHGIVFIDDEVQSGFGRTGKMFACEHFDIVPDIITMAKSIAAGLPLSAVTGRAEIMDAPDVGGIGTTYGGNPLACVAGLKVIDRLTSDNLPSRVDAIGNVIKERFKALQDRYSVIGDIRGLGAMVGVELVKDPKTKEPAKDLAKQVIAECHKRGVIAISAGILGNVLRFLPPLVITDEQLSEALSVFEQAFEAVCSGK